MSEGKTTEIFLPRTAQLLYQLPEYEILPWIKFFQEGFEKAHNKMGSHFNSSYQQRSLDILMKIRVFDQRQRQALPRDITYYVGLPNFEVTENILTEWQIYQNVNDVRRKILCNSILGFTKR